MNKNCNQRVKNSILPLIHIIGWSSISLASVLKPIAHFLKNIKFYYCINKCLFIETLNA